MSRNTRIATPLLERAPGGATALGVETDRPCRSGGGSKARASDQILCTERFAQSAGDLSDVESRALGPVRLKNIAAPVLIFEATPARRRRAAVLVDPACQMRVGAKEAPARLPFGGRTYLFCSPACARAFAAHPECYAAP